MHKKFALLHLVGAFLCLSVFAEPDNGKFFPNAEPLLPNHVFLEAGGGLNFPVEFFNQGTIAMTSYGGNIFGGLGYNLSGWLSSITYTHDMWGEGKGDYALMENFRNNNFELRLRKIISEKNNQMVSVNAGNDSRNRPRYKFNYHRLLSFTQSKIRRKTLFCKIRFRRSYLFFLPHRI